MASDEVKFSIGYDQGPRLMPGSEFAHLAEDLGYDGITIATGSTSFDPFIILAQLASASEHLLLSITVQPLPLIHPLILAKQVATIDQVSNGRFILGVGLGGDRLVQFKNMGIPATDRGIRADESLEILKGLWTHKKRTEPFGPELEVVPYDTFSYHGRIFEFDNAPSFPMPVQKPHPPIWVAGRVGGVETQLDGTRKLKSKSAAIKRAAKYGDGWLPYLMTPEGYRQSVDKLRAYAKEYGRENEAMTLAHTVSFSVGDDYDGALEVAAAGNPYGGHKKEFSAKYDIVGTPRDCIARLEEYVDAGVRHFILKPYVAPELILGQVQRFARDVIPYLKG